MDSKPISLLDEAKLQAAVIVPILRALREQVGKEKADRIVGDSLRTWARDLYHRIGEAKPGTPRQKWDAVWAEDMRPRIGEAVDREMLKDDGTVREYNVTRCQYAEFFRALGEPELGTILLCDSDFHIADVAGDSLEFRRTQTIMKGAPYCDFRYRFR
ncbi:MAG: L-2-amino-thiazoline-4-carboxylic acid hydrolase [Proteobacteria bacterium]|nr:L-2-amino-thiazoline-4-carboxylic acid hydrolase [Pseudomonadota bacterium]